MSTRIMPILCFTCGRLIAHAQHEYEARCDRLQVEAVQLGRRDLVGKACRLAMDACGIRSPCCRAIMMSVVEDNRLLAALMNQRMNLALAKDGSLGACGLMPWFPVPHFFVEDLTVIPDGVTLRARGDKKGGLPQLTLSTLLEQSLYDDVPAPS